MKINAILRDKKDHFVITLYKEIRKKIMVKPKGIILFKIGGKELIRMVNKDFHITLPKKFIPKNKGKICLDILEVFDSEDSKLRDNNLFERDSINILALTPEKTIFGKEIYILDWKDRVYVWYSVSGGVRPLNIKKKINAEKLAELMGFYYGDGNTSKEIRSFRLNNCEPSTLNNALKVLYDLGLNKEMIKVQVIYSSDKEITNLIVQRCINFWANKLGLKKEQIVSINRSKNKRESLKYGSARIFIDNSTLVEILLHGVLKKFIEIIKNPKNVLEKKITVGFLRGLLAAEGSPLLEKNSLRKIGISFNPHSKDLDLYKKILENLDISWKFIHGNELMIHKFENFKRFFELDAFKLHEKRNKKFLFGFKNHKYFKTKF